MAYELVDEPVRGVEAFTQLDNRAVQSQAAILLLLRSQLVFAREYVEAQSALGLPADGAEVVGRDRTLALAGGDLEGFPVPWLSDWGTRFGSAPINGLRQRFGDFVVEGVMQSDPGFIGNVLPVVAVDLFERHNVFSAAVVLEVCLRHPDPLVRAAAGGTYLELSTGEEREGALRTLVAGTFDPDPEVRDMAATLLADSVPGHPRLEELGGGELPGRGGEPLQTALLIHGTWAASSSWWQPGGDFNDYILSNVRPDLYVANDRFGWSGRYSDQERALAALRLSAWAMTHGSMHFDCVIAHSHGCSVAMMATWAGLQIDELVLLSCPFHLPKRFDRKVPSSLETSDCRYLPNFANVKRIESIRVRLDRVILADRGAQRFDLASIHENSPVGWFDHSATHNPATWLRHGIDKWIS